MLNREHPSLADQQDFWNVRWDQIRSPNEWSLRRGQKVEAVLRTLFLRQPRILDMGCGTGWLANQLSQYGEVSGVDLSETGVAMARERFPQARFIAGSIYEVDLPLASFDVAVSVEVLSHVQDQVGYLNRAADLLKPDGYLIMTTDNKFVWDRMDWQHLPPPHIADFLDNKTLLRLLGQQFRVLSTTTLIPSGNRGILRVINSAKLNAALALLIPRHSIDALKERVGLGCTRLILAQKRS